MAPLYRGCGSSSGCAGRLSLPSRANPPFTMGLARMTSLSKLAASIVQSEIRIMSVECAKVGGINLAQGVCDTDLPPQVRDGAIAAIGTGLNSYTRLDGIAELRQAIA